MSDVDRALDLLYSLVLEDGRRWGEAAHGFQREDADAILAPVPGEPRKHFLTRPRGGSKTTDLAGAAIAALVEQAPSRARGYAVAADRDQASLLTDAAGGLVARSGLSSVVTVETARLVNTATQATIAVLPADGPSAWGLLPWLAIIDEVGQWAHTRNAMQVWTAVISALPKVPGSRAVAMTSAGDPGHWSYAILEHARQSAMWRTSEAPGPCPWIDPDELAEQKAILRESEYLRLHMNEWTAAEDALVLPDDLDRAFVLDGPSDLLKGRSGYLVTLDIGLVNDRTVLTVTHRDGDDVYLDRMQVWQGDRSNPVRLETIEDAVGTAHDQYNRPKVILDPWQGVGLLQRLQGRGIKASTFNFSAQSVGRLASGLHLALRDGRLKLYDPGGLRDELAAVRLKETSPGVVRLHHDSNRHDDMAVTLGLAVHEFTSKPSRPSPSDLGRAMATAAVDMAGVDAWDSYY